MNKPPKLVSVGVLEAEALRQEARCYRQIASSLLGAELAADWSKVAAVRAHIVELAMGLEDVAARKGPPEG